MAESVFRHSQVERFVVLWRPVGVLVLGLLLPLLVGQVRPDQVHLHQRLERLDLGPPEIVSGNDWKREKSLKCRECLTF